MADGIANGNYAQYFAQAFTPQAMGMFGPVPPQMSLQGIPGGLAGGYGGNPVLGQEFGYPSFGQLGQFGNSLAANPFLAGNPFQGATQAITAQQISFILGQLANQIAAQGAFLAHLAHQMAAQGPHAQSRLGQAGNVFGGFAGNGFAGNQGAGSHGLGFGNQGVGGTFGQPAFGPSPYFGYGLVAPPSYANVVPPTPWGINRPTIM